MFNSLYNTPMYNPNLTPQQRITQMEQQYFPPAIQQSIQQGFKIIPVANIEEANATPVDTLNDIPSFFFNRAKKEIYLKQYNSQTGLPIFEIFQLAQKPTEHISEKKQTNTYEKDFKALNDKIDGLYSLISSEQKGNKNVK